jgi:formamidopyrimidine-DNA glycosylase
MPELPEVETFKRRVADKCRGRTVDHVEVPDPGILEGISAREIERRLRGERLGPARRYGKHLFISLSSDSVLALHFGMNGFPELVPKGAADPPYTRLVLAFSDGERLAYVNPRRLGRVGLAESVEAFIAASGLGSDVLEPAFDGKAFAAIVESSKRDIKSVLMDQALMAGIGNIYSDEILFQARVFPGAAANRLPSDAVKRLFSALGRTLETAIERGAGSEGDEQRLPAGFLLRERHAGGHCPRCGAPLATAKKGGRTSYYCRRCQTS